MANITDPKAATAARILRTEKYAAKLQKMFSETVNELLALPLSLTGLGTGEMYSFDGDTDKVQRQVEQLLRRLHSASVMAVEKGVQLEWGQANAACDAIIKSHFAKQVLDSRNFRGWNARNGAAMRQFIDRSDAGMNLSDRIWKPCRQLRDEMEVALTVSIGEGMDAGTISRRVRQYLNDPDLMFRRFRYKDAEGRWQKKWKKRIADPDNPGKYKWIDYDKDSYHDQWTGKGYYKSSAQNAMRVARTETNIAYRRADHARWQGLDFVLGQRVQLSKMHPEPDICDTLAGDYPKEFIFDGWHPQCFCFVTPILVDEQEIEKMNEAFANGEQYEMQGEQITEYPKQFTDWVRDNSARIQDAVARGKEPYFIRNNMTAVDRIINPQAQPKQQAQPNVNLSQERIDKFADMLKTTDWNWEDMNQWMDMSIDDRIEALKKSGISGLVPDDFFEEDSMYADIYKLVSRENLLGNIDDVLSNIANGYDMTDMDSYLAFYSDGRIISTRADDYELEGVKKLPRRGLIALMTNGGILENQYWVKNAEGFAAIKRYTGYKTVKKGVIVDAVEDAEALAKDASLKSKPLAKQNLYTDDYCKQIRDRFKIRGNKSPEEIKEFFKDSTWKKMDLLKLNDDMRKTFTDFGINGVDKMNTTLLLGSNNSLMITWEGGHTGIVLTRTFSIDKNGATKVHHDLFSIPEEYQGKGMSKAVFRGLYEQYQAAGVKYMDVFANIDIGGYTWAKFGFCIKDKNEVLRAVNFKKLTKKQKDEITDIIERHFAQNNTPFPMNKIAALPYGKKALLGQYWNGVLDLTDPNQRKYFENYIGFNNRGS